MTDASIRTCYAVQRESDDPIAGDFVMTETFERGDKTPFKITFAIVPRFHGQNGQEDGA